MTRLFYLLLLRDHLRDLLECRQESTEKHGTKKSMLQQSYEAESFKPMYWLSRGKTLCFIEKSAEFLS